MIYPDANMIIKYNPKLIAIARKLRVNSTKTEIYLWNELKSKKLMGYAFKRQKPIGNYIVDFFAPKLNLVVEIDGITHDYKLEKDEVRQEFLQSISLTVLRFRDSHVKNNLDGVIISLREWIENNQQ